MGLKIFKTIVGILIVSHMFPLLLMVLMTEHTWIYAYMVGMLLNVGTMAFVCLVKFLSWCFDVGQ